MALKDIFTMVKADRYTADGCEELNKAREADVEDRRYNIGEISEKTGLQKTANGWVKPKSGKQAGVKKTEEKTTNTSTAITEWEESVKKDAKAYNENMVILQNEKGETTAVRESSPDVEKAEAHGYKKMSLVRPDGSVKKHEGNAGSKPDAADQRDQIGGEIKDNLEAAKYYFNKAQGFSPTDPSYKTYMTKAKQYNDEAKAQADDNGFDFEEMHNSGITQAVNKYAEEQNKTAGQYSVENLPAVGSEVTFESTDKTIKGKGNIIGFKTKNDKTYARVKTDEGSYDVALSLLRGGRSGKDANKGKVITGNVEGKGGLWEPIYGEPQEDSAPRVLTGDTRIRVRKA